MKKIILAVVLIAVFVFYYSLSRGENDPKVYKWQFKDVETEKVGSDSNYVSTSIEEGIKVNGYGQLFNLDPSIKDIQHFKINRDGNKRVNKTTAVFLECDYKSEYFGETEIKSCKKGTGIDNTYTYLSSSTFNRYNEEIIKVSYTNKNDLIHTFDTIINKNIGLGWVNTNLVYNSKKEKVKIKVGFNDGQTMVCDGHLYDTIQYCEYKGKNIELPNFTMPTIKGRILEKLGYNFTDTTIRLDQEVVNIIFEDMKINGLYHVN